MAFNAWTAAAVIRGGAYYDVTIDGNPCYTVFIRRLNVNNTRGTRIAFALLCLASMAVPASYVFTDHAADAAVGDLAAAHNICVATTAIAFADITNNTDLAINYLGIRGVDAREIAHFIDSGRKWLVELCGARVIRELSNDNVENYFLMCGFETDVPNVLLTIITHIARTSRADLMTNEVRTALRDTPWGRYRISVSSLGSCFANFRTSYGATVTDRVITSVPALDDLIATPWDVTILPRIPKGDIAVIAMGLDVAGIFPRGWVSGDREMRTMGQGQRGRLQALFRRIIALMSNTAAIEAAPDINTALTAAGY